MSNKLEELFEVATNDFLDFEKIKAPKHTRRDLCAFLMLAELVPSDDGPIVSASEHDEFYLAVDCDKLAEVATQEVVTDLHRCGVRYITEFDCLAMFA